MQEELADIFNNLVFSPNQNQIEIDFDLEKKIFIFSIAVYRSKRFSKSVASYVAAREGKKFKPHSTFFSREEEEVFLIQKVPFHFSLQTNLRKEMLEFLQLAKKCHRTLYEMALEDSYQEALDSLIAE